MLFGKKEKKTQLPDLPPLPAKPQNAQQNNQQPGQPNMPSFPDSPEKRQAQQGMSGSIQPPGRQDSFLHGPQPQGEKKVKVVEMEEWHPQNPQHGSPGPAWKEHPELHEKEGDYNMKMPEIPHMPELPEKETHHQTIQEPEEMEEPEEEKPEELQHVPEPKRLYVQKPHVAHKLAVQPQQQADVFVRIDKFHSARKSLNEIQNRLDDIDELIRRIKDTKLKEEQELASWEKDLMQVKSRIQTVTENIFEKVE